MFDYQYYSHSLMIDYQEFSHSLMFHHQKYSHFLMFDYQYCSHSLKFVHQKFSAQTLQDFLCPVYPKKKLNRKLLKEYLYITLKRKNIEWVNQNRYFIIIP